MTHKYKILTLPHPCLTTKTTSIENTSAGLAKAREIISCLINTLQPRMPAAGLAAPQIGISERVMIFSWDRTVENLQAAINLRYEPLNSATQVGWEGCFSVPLALTKISRYHNILASFTNTNGQHVQYILRGFTARVFQHETDHLDGIETVHKEGAKIERFTSHADLLNFLTEIKKGDQAHYFKPEQIEGSVS